MNSDYNIILQPGEKIRWRAMIGKKALKGSGITSKRWYEATVINCDHPNGLSLQIRNDGDYIQNVQHWTVGTYEGFSEVEILDVDQAKKRLLENLQERMMCEEERHKATMNDIQFGIGQLLTYDPNKGNSK